MAAAIQIIIAGTLLLAWIWVLGRPLMSNRAPTAYEEFLARNPERAAQATARAEAAGDSDQAVAVDAAGPDSSISDSSITDSSMAGPSIEAGSTAPGALSMLTMVRRWWQRPPHVWRRQLLMATMLATFVSFFLAVALRNSLGNTFLYLFAMMVLGLVIHLGIAAYVGGQILQTSRATAVRTVQAQVRPGAMAIKADQVGAGQTDGRRSILEDDDVSLFEFDGDADDGEDDSAFNLAADIAWALDSDEQAGTIDQVAEVSEMIESEWGDEPSSAGLSAEPSPGESPANDSRPADPTANDSQPADRQSGDPRPPDPLPADPLLIDADEEPRFRRAAKDEPPRPKRKPKPIYIESQLDDEPGDGAQAVNYP